MALTLEDIDALIGRQRDPIWVGELPYDVALALGLRHPNVYLAEKQVRHIFEDHKDIDKFELLHMPFAIRKGLLIRERAKPECVIANYQDPNSRRRYIVAMKVLTVKCEAWVSSFYRGRTRQTRAHLKRGEILKTHD